MVSEYWVVVWDNFWRAMLGFGIAAAIAITVVIATFAVSNATSYVRRHGHPWWWALPVAALLLGFMVLAFGYGMLAGAEVVT